MPLQVQTMRFICHPTSAKTHHTFRASALQAWREVVAAA